MPYSDMHIFGLKGGHVRLPRWMIFIRGVQFVLAVLVLALCAAAVNIEHGRQRHPALIPIILIACITLVIVLPLVTPLVALQQAFYHPFVALALDGFAMLFWLAAVTAMACYQRVFYYNVSYSSSNDSSDPSKRGLKLGRRQESSAYREVYPENKRSWKCAAAGTWFGGFEFGLFILSTLLFLFYYHHHVSGTTAPGITTEPTFEHATPGQPIATNPSMAEKGTARTATGNRKSLFNKPNFFNRTAHPAAGAPTPLFPAMDNAGEPAVPAGVDAGATPLAPAAPAETADKPPYPTDEGFSAGTTRGTV